MRLLAFDIGGSAVKYGIVSEEGTVSENGSFATPSSLEQLLNNIASVFHNFNADAAAISSPGAVDPATGFVHGISAVDYLHGPNIKEAIMNAVQAPVEIENDGNCAALAELWLGEASDINDCILIVIGSGIGGAMIKDRRIHAGSRNKAGEFGLIITDRNLEDGSFHVWSHYSSVKTLRRAEAEAGLPEGSLSGEMLFSEAEHNPIFAKHVERFYSAAAVGLLTLQQCYDPERILIGGGISARPDLIDQLNRHIDMLAEPHRNAFIKPDLRVCRFRGQANLIGAACHFRSLHGEAQ